MAATPHTQVGSFEAKAKLSEILRRVEQGERFTITKRGRAVAEIVPVQSSSESSRAEAIDAMLRFPRIQGISGDTVLAWIRQGRK
jgi:prevent-host-death family protein